MASARALWQEFKRSALRTWKGITRSMNVLFGVDSSSEGLVSLSLKV
jgi:hypothetical protein